MILQRPCDAFQLHPPLTADLEDMIINRNHHRLLPPSRHPFDQTWCGERMTDVTAHDEETVMQEI